MERQLFMFLFLVPQLISMEQSQPQFCLSRENRKEKLMEFVKGLIKDKTDNPNHLNRIIKVQGYDWPSFALFESCASDEMLDITSELLMSGANPNYRGCWAGIRTVPLHRAVFLGAVETVKALLKAGAQVDIHNSNDESPLQRIIRACSDDYLCNPYKPTLAEEQQNYWQRQMDIARLLLSHGAEPNIKNSSGQTPLFSLVADDYEVDKAKQLSSILLEHGARTSIKDKEGRSITDLAKQNNYKLDLVNFIKAKRKEIKKRNK